MTTLFLLFNKAYQQSYLSRNKLQTIVLKSYSCLPNNYAYNGSVYIHWPYCKRRCSYCNFIKFIPRKNTSWTFSDLVIENALVSELESVLKNSCIKNVTSIFFGGGTPSLARPELVEKILETIRKVCNLQKNAEITLEANPTALESKKLKLFKDAGINRLSLGIQSLEDEFLQMLHRDHSSTEALLCLEEAKKLFPHKLSVDMMFALPHQTVELWKKDLDLILSVCDDHLSLYQLTIESGTQLSKEVQTGSLRLPSKEREAEMYNMAVDLLSQKKIYRYEISNFARSCATECIHNKAIWQGGQYIGVGPGAHSRVVKEGLIPEWYREARINAPDPASWLFQVKEVGNGIRKVVCQTRNDIQMEYIATSLRTNEGARKERWKIFSSSPLENVFPPTILDPEMLILENDVLKATPKGMNVLDALLPNIINAIMCHNAENGLKHNLKQVEDISKHL